MAGGWTIRAAFGSWGEFRRCLRYHWLMVWSQYPRQLWSRIRRGWWLDEQLIAYLIAHTADETYEDGSGRIVAKWPPFADGFYGHRGLTDGQVVRMTRVLGRILERAPSGSRPTAVLCLAAVVRSASWRKDRGRRAERAIERARSLIARWPEVRHVDGGWLVGEEAS